MEMTVTKQGDIALVRGGGPLLQDVDAGLTLMSRVRELTGCDKMILEQADIAEEFFDLKTTVAGEILQKYVNYRMQMGIVGTFEDVERKSLRDFIRETNRGNQFCFVSTHQEAVQRLSPDTQGERK